MKQTKIEAMARLLNELAKLGFSYSEAQSLRRIEMTLQRWGEGECGDSNDYTSWCIVRDEETGKAYREVHPHTGKSYRSPIPDRETGAKNRLAKIMAKHPELWSYHQGDPRGCALYIGRKSDLKANEDINAVYSRGLGVCI